MFSKVLATAGLLAGSLVFSANAASTPTISAVGNKFFYSTGEQYFIKGKLPIVCNTWILLTAARNRIPIDSP